MGLIFFMYFSSDYAINFFYYSLKWVVKQCAVKYKLLMFYLNTTAPYESFRMAINDKIYTDKTMMIKNITEHIGIEKRFICITRPRRFGKSMNANMLAAFYSKGADASDLFSDRNISNNKSCMDHSYIK